MDRRIMQHPGHPQIKKSPLGFWLSGATTSLGGISSQKQFTYGENDNNVAMDDCNKLNLYIQ